MNTTIEKIIGFIFAISLLLGTVYLLQNFFSKINPPPETNIIFEQPKPSKESAEDVCQIKVSEIRAEELIQCLRNSAKP